MATGPADQTEVPMRFLIASPEHARRKARLLKDLLDRLGAPAPLTACQATLARALGYASWAEMLATRGTPSPLDEQADPATIRLRIERQVEAVAAGHRLDPARAAGVARALALTARERSTEPDADLVAFVPRPRRAVPKAEAEAGRDAGEVRLWLLQWEESEAGWGTRPDGYSVHADPDAARAYVAAYWARMPERPPAEYERPSSDLAEVRVGADHPAAVALREGRNRLWGEAARACDAVWPRAGGGWVALPGGGRGWLR